MGWGSTNREESDRLDDPIRRYFPQGEKLKVVNSDTIERVITFFSSMRQRNQKIKELTVRNLD